MRNIQYPPRPRTITLPVWFVYALAIIAVLCFVMGAMNNQQVLVQGSLYESR